MYYSETAMKNKTQTNKKNVPKDIKIIWVNIIESSD